MLFIVCLDLFHPCSSLRASLWELNLVITCGGVCGGGGLTGLWDYGYFDVFEEYFEH